MLLSELSEVEQTIYDCLNLDNPKSFFLFAGAGSGKTRSLVEVLKKFRNEHSKKFRLTGQKVAIITYTNAACDEIKRRLEFDSIFAISTIHSFAWELIKPFQTDIKKWIVVNLEDEIEELQEKLNGAKSTTTKTYISNKEKISSKKEKLKKLNLIKKFIYNPNSNSDTKDSLNHTEVIKMAAKFIINKPLMQNILARKYPVLLIDESQDTKKELIDAFFSLQSKHSDKFALGLFGDTMQRIYMDGKENFELNIPENWITPAKTINYRCPKRVITLINKIRSDADSNSQIASDNNVEGIIRVFLVPLNANKKVEIEQNIRAEMTKYTEDNLWSNTSEVKILTLEHHMAAIRGGFDKFFRSLYEANIDKTSLLNGSLSEISFLAEQIVPLVSALKSQNKFAIAKIVKQYSPLLKHDALKIAVAPANELKKSNEAVNKLYSLWDNDAIPTLKQILINIKETGLFNLTDTYRQMLAIDEADTIEYNEDDENQEDSAINAWTKALEANYAQFEAYLDYISGNSSFGTHHGIKGLEFPRVMVIIDDKETRGHIFKYYKLFDIKMLSDTDRANPNEGKETSIDRIRRLFYVTCSRAQKSLAIVIYADNAAQLKANLINKEWFSEEEIFIL